MRRQLSDVWSVCVWVLEAERFRGANTETNTHIYIYIYKHTYTYTLCCHKRTLSLDTKHLIHTHIVVASFVVLILGLYVNGELWQKGALQGGKMTKQLNHMYCRPRRQSSHHCYTLGFDGALSDHGRCLERSNQPQEHVFLFYIHLRQSGWNFVTRLHAKGFMGFRCMSVCVCVYMCLCVCVCVYVFVCVCVCVGGGASCLQQQFSCL